MVVNRTDVLPFAFVRVLSCFSWTKLG